MCCYEIGKRGATTKQKGLQKPLHSISLMALLAEKEGIWGPFLVVTTESTLLTWQQEIKTLVPLFNVKFYGGTDTDRGVLETLWDNKDNVNMRDSPFHVFITSYQSVLSDA